MLLSQTLPTVGLLFDLVGGILLAVEAIRLPNLLILRDEVLPRVHLFFESPLLFWEGPVTVAELEENAHRGFGGRRRLYVAFHFFAVVVVLFLLEWTRLAIGIEPHDPLPTAVSDWEAGWRWAVLGGSVLVIVCLLPFSLGCWVHRSFERAIDGFVALLVAVERGTPNGATGITGALFFVAGFVVQLLGVWT